MQIYSEIASIIVDTLGGKVRLSQKNRADGVLEHSVSPNQIACKEATWLQTKLFRIPPKHKKSPT